MPSMHMRMPRLRMMRDASYRTGHAFLQLRLVPTLLLRVPEREIRRALRRGPNAQVDIARQRAPRHVQRRNPPGARVSAVIIMRFRTRRVHAAGGGLGRELELVRVEAAGVLFLGTADVVVASSLFRSVDAIHAHRGDG